VGHFGRAGSIVYSKRDIDMITSVGLAGKKTTVYIIKNGIQSLRPSVTLAHGHFGPLTWAEVTGHFGPQKKVSSAFKVRSFRPSIVLFCHSISQGGTDIFADTALRRHGVWMTGRTATSLMKTVTDTKTQTQAQWCCGSLS